MPEPFRCPPVLAITLVLAAAVPAQAQTTGPTNAPVILQPHRIAYQLALDPRRAGSTFTAANGLMVLEFTGNACEGYGTAFRQVTELTDPDGSSKRMDFNINLFEEGAGKRFRFAVRNNVDGELTRDAEGEAVLGPEGALAVTLKRPRNARSDHDGNVEFPAAHSLKLIRAALAGERSFQARVFDGSEGGEKVYDTVATIGAPLDGDKNARIEPAMKGATLEGLKRWPVSIAYYEDQPGDRVPVYTMRGVTFANGVVSDLVFEFPDFSLAARATRYEALPREACNR